MQTTAEVTETPKRPFPVLATSKILALGRFTSPPPLEQLKTKFPKEVPETLRLYLDGKIEQWSARQDQKGQRERHAQYWKSLLSPEADLRMVFRFEG
jgi:hypothetical protein